MLSVAVDRWRGNAATVLRVGWGAVMRRAHEPGDSRRSISKPAHRVEPAVIHAQAGGLRDEARWEAWVGPEGLPEAKQHAVAATGSAMGLRLGHSITLLAIVRRFSRCGIDSHSSLSASAFSRNTDALCEGIFRPRGPKATLLLTGPHRLIPCSRG
jgi:hypothetical protein